MEDLPERILAETYAHLLAGGVSRTRLDQVASALRISKKTLYAHFITKAALVQAVFTRYQRRAKAQHQLFQAAATAPEELRLLLRWFREHYLPDYMAEMHRAAPALYQAWHQYLIGLIDRNLCRGRAEGSYRVTLDTQVLSRLYVGQVTLLGHLFPDTATFPPARLHHVVGEHFLRSILKSGC